MWVLDNDVDMYHAETDLPAVARSTIVSNLGQVDHVFSDKTGTLTRNVMRFSRCDVKGIAYGAPTFINGIFCRWPIDGDLSNMRVGAGDDYSWLCHISAGRPL